jgi:hypothetical protein
MRRMTLKAGLISFVVFAMLAGVSPMAAAGASPKAAGGLGAAAGYAVLADGTGLTCTGSTVTGLVGVSSSSTAITQTGCTLTVQVAPGPYKAFLKAYSGIAANFLPCTVLTGTLAGVSLPAGTYCFDAAAVLTGTLTLTGTGPWLFEIGTSGTGALTATDFTVVGSNPCNVTWWVRQAVTLTRATFQGTILAGADITLTDTSLAGRALATGAVTMTGSNIVGCTGGGTGARQHCNQGVGNGPEGCDPGNSNQGNASRSNDELGGTPGHPGRQGGNRNANVQAKGNSTLHSTAKSK